ncbi:hypothetical protein B0H14DRAFT_2597357 [Mycena olivaceomarginata]|nr:hypothetical protein B0H14DRAFT_2597357 [Mycena olivaceomarginata]
MTILPQMNTVSLDHSGTNGYGVTGDSTRHPAAAGVNRRRAHCAKIMVLATSTRYSARSVSPSMDSAKPWLSRFQSIHIRRIGAGRAQCDSEVDEVVGTEKIALLDLKSPPQLDSRTVPLGIFETLKLIPKIDGLIRNGGAPSSSWEATKKDLQALCNELTHLTTIHPSGANQFIDERLKDERERCFSTASEFHSKLAASRSLIQKAMWITSEEAELSAFQRQLAGRRAALSGIVDQINMISLKRVQAMGEEVHFRTDRIADGLGGVSQKLTDQEQTLSGGFDAVRSRVEDLDERLKDGVAGVNQQLIGQKRKFKLLEESSLEEKLEKWLEFPPGMAKKQHDSQKIHHEGTGEWFLGGPEFAKWKDSDDSAYLWINGPSMMKFHCDQDTVRESNPEGCCRIFLLRLQRREQQQVEIMLRSIVLQLSAQASDPYAALNAQYNFYDGQSLPTYRNLVDVLETLVSDAGRTYLVLDALDESKDMTLLIRLISELQRWTNSRLHLLLTSQPRDIFTAAFVAVPQVALEFEVTKGDIRVFVSSELQSNPDLEHLADRTEEVASKVVLKSSGMFRLAACLLDELCRRKLDPDVDAIIANLPNDLFGIYGRFLEPIHPKDFIHVARVLHWLSAGNFGRGSLQNATRAHHCGTIAGLVFPFLGSIGGVLTLIGGRLCGVW